MRSEKSPKYLDAVLNQKEEKKMKYEKQHLSQEVVSRESIY